MVWVPLHIAIICRCGLSYQSLTVAPQENTAYTVFFPAHSSHVFIDTDLKAFIFEIQEYKRMVESLGGSQITIAQADSPQLFVAIDGILQFITPEKAGFFFFLVQL